jgi:HEAT repeat protein
MRACRAILIPVLFFACVSPFFAQETGAARDKRSDTIKFGLEGDVLELIKTLRSEKNAAYDESLYELYTASRNDNVRDALIGYFTDEKNPVLRDHALKVLGDPFSYKKTTVSAMLDYAMGLPLKDAAPSVRKMIEDENRDFLDKAVRTLGRIGSAEDAKYLVGYMSGEIEGDEKTRLIIRQNVMTAIGELKCLEVAPDLIEIARDEDENTVIRATAGVAAAKLLDSGAIPVLVDFFAHSDPILRSAAINGLSNFDSSEARAILMEGIKDSHYKVRLDAIDAVTKSKMGESVDYLLFRAKTDPVEQVRVKAIESLAVFGGSAPNDWLVECFKDEKATDKVRVRIAASLLEQNPGLIMPDFEKVILASLKDDKKKDLRYALGKLVTEKNVSGAEPIAIAYLSHKDTLTKSIGLDMYEKFKFSAVTETVEGIAKDDKMGALQRRAKKILGIPDVSK